jgi:lactoylglutathione lyase
MIRIKDQRASLDFYQNVMGMQLKRTSENKDNGFNLYFLGYGAPAAEKTANGVNPTAHDEGLLELTWNYGTENDANFKYHNGNDDSVTFASRLMTWMLRVLDSRRRRSTGRRGSLTGA